MDGLRKAALTLSSLGEADRAWLLEQLGEKERARLTPLLGELRQLGLEVDAGLMRELESKGPAAQPAAAPARAAPAVSVAARPIEAARAQVVHEVLAGEPDWLIAALARARPWPWREAFLRLLGTERRLQVQRVLPSGVALRPKALEALLAAIEKRLEESLADRAADELVPPAPPARKPFWQGVMAWRR